MVTTEQDPKFFEWANTILKTVYAPGPGCKVLSNVAADGAIRAVVIYSRFSKANCEMSVASDGSGHWVTREFWRAAFGYPFLQCGLVRVTAIVEHDNEAALKMDFRLGFVQEGRIRLWTGEKDGIVLGMLKSECRWIK
ncbi:MAG: Burkholderia virus Bcepmigl [Pseudomonadota bacterium]|jgi:RimJ/RimL family protein N-acetyltransferase